MMIFVCLNDPVKYQQLSKRFYNGILPRWFNQIKGVTLEIRLTEQTGVSSERYTVFKLLTLNYIEGLIPAQKRTLHITGASMCTYGRCNIFLSTREQSKEADW